jgi:hypothetical protein
MRPAAFALVAALGCCKAEPALRAAPPPGPAAPVPSALPPGPLGASSAAAPRAGGDATPDGGPSSYAGPLAQSVAWGDGYTMSAGFHDQIDAPGRDASALEALVVRMERDGPGGKALVWQREGFAAVSGLGRPPPGFEACDYRVALGTFGGADARGARVGLACRNGEDMFTARELAILLEVTDRDAAPFPPLWVGEADFASDENGVCTRRTAVTFALSGPTLTQTIVDERREGRDCRPGAPPPKATTTRRTVKVRVRRRAR